MKNLSKRNVEIEIFLNRYVLIIKFYYDIIKRQKIL